MQHTDYLNFWKAKATSHYQIRHDADLAGSPSGKRVSFFRMSNEAEMQQAIPDQVDYPCLCLPIYFGRLQEDAGLVRDVMTGAFEVRGHVAEPLDFTAVENVRGQCKQIGMDIIASMLQQMDEEGECGPFSYIDANSVKYDFTGPINTSDYGCRFQFEFMNTAFNALSADLSTVFS